MARSGSVGFGTENFHEGVVRFDHDHYLEGWTLTVGVGAAVIGLLVGDATRAGYGVTVTDPRAL
ncbi:hypothetical protein AQJ64_08330 [Streptomyces griseoruber]|uniref:Uncharacterized protein n=1 Tax=Streptomyces griseoruber TaxID=1943 RepID=A0A101T7S1_9ACTN|nr:hypothetical protein AQJ64_08330 [Streptomyces griseoruber]